MKELKVKLLQKASQNLLLESALRTCDRKPVAQGLPAGGKKGTLKVICFVIRDIKVNKVHIYGEKTTSED